MLPRSRAEDARIREWAQTHAFEFSEAARRAGRRVGDPDDVWWTAPAPIPTAEGYRIVWVRSSQKTGRDAESRGDRIEKGIAALEEIGAKLAGPRSRLRKRVAVEEAARGARAAAKAERWIGFEVSDQSAPRRASARRRAGGRAGTSATAR